MKELIEIQAELKAPKNQYNAFGKYKYRSCEDILEAVKPLLKSKGCSMILSDEVKDVAGIPYVEATAIIQKGDESVTVMAQAGIDPNRKGMDIAQSFGSSSSYARKYALNGLFLIDDTKDADATNDHGKAAPAATPAATPTPKAKETLNATHKDWDKCVKYLKGAGSMTELKKRFEMTKEVEEKLVALTLG